MSYRHNASDTKTNFPYLSMSCLPHKVLIMSKFKEALSFTRTFISLLELNVLREEIVQNEMEHQL